MAVEDEEEMGEERRPPRPEDIADARRLMPKDVLIATIVVSAWVRELTSDWIVAKTHIMNELTLPFRTLFTRRDESTKQHSPPNEMEMAVIALWERLTGVRLDFGRTYQQRRDERWWIPDGKSFDDTDVDPSASTHTYVAPSKSAKSRKRRTQKAKTQTRKSADGPVADFDPNDLYERWTRHSERRAAKNERGR